MFGGYPIRWTGDVRILDGTRIAEIDKLGYLVNMDIVHHRVHEGEFYRATDYQASAAPTYFLFINPQAVKEYHTAYYITSDVAGLMETFHSVNCGTFAKGTQFYGYNLNQKVGGTSNLLKYSVPLGLTGTGTLLWTQRIGIGGNQKSGGDSRGGQEIILANNGTYAIRFTPDAAAKFTMENALCEV